MFVNYRCDSISFPLCTGMRFSRKGYKGYIDIHNISLVRERGSTVLAVARFAFEQLIVRSSLGCVYAVCKSQADWTTFVRAPNQFAVPMKTFAWWHPVYVFYVKRVSDLWVAGETDRDLCPVHPNLS